MASPPFKQEFSALSPPYPMSASLPQPPKRRQTDMPSSASSIKRRKASMLSTTSASSHPLRQTSFPPEVSSQTHQMSRSPSVETMSVVSNSVAGGSKKRKRKSKGGVGANDDVSTAGGKGKGKRRASKDHHSEDEEDDGPDGEATVRTTLSTVEEKLKEIQHRAMLVRSLDENQMLRYEAWRSSKLADATVRRMINQTLSQSAPHPVILAVKSIAKLFAGDIIEGARKVQTQWLEATEESQVPHEYRAKHPEQEPDGHETRRGPLLPDHLRESLRRNKAEGDGGLAGQLGLWQLQSRSGVERFGVKVGGKRLFK